MPAVTNVPLDDELLRFFEGLARSPEGRYIKEQFLEPWMAAVDRRLRTAASDYQLVQGEARTLERLVDLLTVTPPKESIPRAARRVLIEGETY